MAAHAIIVFDGVCNLCNTAVNFVIRRDHSDYFLFASLQSEEGKKILADHNLPENKMNTFILIEKGKVYDCSTAALRVLKKLKGLWRLLYGFIIVPKFMRDSIYKVISKNRYVWFGKKDECMAPAPGLKTKFLN